jgi:hypothetical protein
MPYQLIYDVSPIRERFNNLFFRDVPEYDRTINEAILLKDLLLHRLHIIYCVPVTANAFTCTTIDNLLEHLQYRTHHYGYQGLIRKCRSLDTPIMRTMRSDAEIFSGRQITRGGIINDCFILELDK